MDRATHDAVGNMPSSGRRGRTRFPPGLPSQQLSILQSCADPRPSHRAAPRMQLRWRGHRPKSPSEPPGPKRGREPMRRRWRAWRLSMRPARATTCSPPSPRPNRDVVVVTADRELAERIRAANAEVVGPNWLLAQLVDRTCRTSRSPWDEDGPGTRRWGTASPCLRRVGWACRRVGAFPVPSWLRS
jgi:hypothetical protein